MKKIYALTGVLLLMGMAMTGCKDDKEPVIQIPTEFKLNTPPMVNYLYDLAGNEQSTIDLNVSQANYGMAIVPVYTVQLSLDGNFTTPYEMLNGDTGEFTGDYFDVAGAYTSVNIKVPASNLCVGICSLLGYWRNEQQPIFEENDQNPMDIWVRVVSTVENYPAGTIASNAVKLTVLPFFSVRQPGEIFLIGTPQGWNIDSSEMVLKEPDSEIDSHVYYGTFDLAPNDDGYIMFRFYTALGDWEANSIGYQEPDNATDFDVETEFENGVFESAAVKGKGSWNFINWEGGTMNIKVDLNTMKVVFEIVE